jgi:hypothetical protein
MLCKQNPANPPPPESAAIEATLGYNPAQAATTKQ